MAITASAVATLVTRYQMKIQKQALLSNPIVDKGVIETVKRPGARGTVILKAGELGSSQWIADGGTLPTGGALTPTVANYDPAFLLARLAIPRGGAMLAASKQDSVDIVFEQMDSCGETLGRQLGRAIFGSAIYTLASGDDVDASSDANITVADAAGFRVGMVIDVYNGATLRESATVQAVTPPTSPTGNWTITLTANAAATFVAGDDIYLSGAKSNGMNSLNDVTAAASLYGVSNTSAYDWAGILDSSTTTLTAPLLRSLMTKVQQKRGKKPSHVLVNPQNEQRLYEAMNDGMRFISGKVDEYGLQMQFAGVPVFCDENCGDKSVYLFQKDDVKLHEFRPFAADVDGDGKTGMGRSGLLVSPTKFEFDCQVWGSHQLRVERRNGTGRMSAITA